MALFKLAFACLRKAPREFLGIAIADGDVPLSKEGTKRGRTKEQGHSRYGCHQ
jgi:hypothetical protein